MRTNLIPIHFVAFRFDDTDPSLLAESLPLAAVEDTSSQDPWEGKGVPVEALVTGDGVEGAGMMEEGGLSVPAGEDGTAFDLPVSA